MDMDIRLFALSEANGKHTGFCLGTYNFIQCEDCGMEAECLNLCKREKVDNENKNQS